MKKGDKVVRIASWNGKGAVYVERFLVSSWGKKQGTLIRQDGTNAEFRIYTARANHLGGTTDSSMVVLEADYSPEVAMKFAQECVADEQARIQRRSAWVEARYAPGSEAPYTGTLEENLEFERRVLAKRVAELQAPSVVVK